MIRFVGKREYSKVSGEQRADLMSRAINELKAPAKHNLRSAVDGTFLPGAVEDLCVAILSICMCSDDESHVNRICYMLENEFEKIILCLPRRNDYF